MKKFVCFLLITILALGCVSVASASLNAYYSNGKIVVTNSGSGMTRINMNGASTGYFLGGSNTSVTLTPPAGATSVTITGVVDPAFGGDGGSVTVNIGGGGGTVINNPTTAPTTNPGIIVVPTTAPTNPPYSLPTTAPVGGPSVSAGNYNNGTLTVSAAGISTPSAIYVDGIPTGISIDSPGSKAVKVGNLTAGTHVVQLYTWNGVVSSSFTVNAQPTVHTHTWGGWTVTKSASCEGAGEQVHTCTTCGQTETQRISPLGHRYVVESETDRAINYRCSNCGKHMTKEKPVYATTDPSYNPFLKGQTVGPTGSSLSSVTKNAYGHILWDSTAMSVDYDAYRDTQDANTIVIEVEQSNRTSKPTEIGLYLDGDTVNTLKGSGYSNIKFVNGKAILNISLANVNDAWFTTDETINFRVFTTDPNAAGGVMVKVEAELATGSNIQPSNSITGVVLKGATDILVAQNGVYDITK